MNEICQIQAKYDHEILSQKYQQKILNIIYIVSVGLLLLLIHNILLKNTNRVKTKKCITISTSNQYL